MKHDVTVPTEPKADAKEMHDKLAQLSGDAFDKEFANFFFWSAVNFGTEP
jgi:uncharacterized protein DUF4142